jgi:predicted anti-sigma-YlaC factor YlaD
VSLRLDGELSPFEDAELAQHLATCAACRAFEADVGAVMQIVQAAPLEELQFPIVLPRRRRPSLRQAQVAVAAAVVAAIGVGSMLGHGVSPVSLENPHPSRAGQATARPAYLDSADYEQRLIKQIRNLRRLRASGHGPL